MPCLNVLLPYPIADSHGKDFRDWVNEGHTATDLLKLLSSAMVISAPSGKKHPGCCDYLIGLEPTKKEPITNAIVEFSEDDEGAETRKTVPLEIGEIVARTIDQTNGWPRRVGKSLFVHDAGGIHWLDSAPALFGWLGRKQGVIDWYRGIGCTTKEEFYHELRRTAEQLIAVEHLPHEPPIAGHYYAHDELPEPTGEHIIELVSRFSPATEADAWLILAMFATLFWGGNGGSRPIFTITSDAGRGAGKTTLPDMAAQLVGGFIELSQNEDASIMRQRLLSPEGIKMRIARLDNVKSHKFSWSDFESMVTSPIISGKQMYVGEGSRPNNITWMITINGVSFSTDIAQRSIIIKLAKPTRNPKWKSDTIAFIKQYRMQIISDLLFFLRQPIGSISCVTRWAEWEESVLGRMQVPALTDDGNPFGIAGIQAVIAERSKESDVESEEVDAIRDYFARQLAELNYHDQSKVHIPTKIVGDWMNIALNEKRSSIACSRILQQYANEGVADWIIVNPSRTYGRGFIWNPMSDADADYDIEDRIEMRKKSRDEKTPWKNLKH